MVSMAMGSAQALGTTNKMITTAKNIAMRFERTKLDMHYSHFLMQRSILAML